MEIMVSKEDEQLVMRAIALCFKPYLKPEEAYIYCNLRHSQFAKKVEEFGIYKTNSGYYKKEDLDKMLSGQEGNIAAKLRQLEMQNKKRQ